MAQGTVKLGQKKASGGRSNGGATKKGRRVISPKAKGAVKHNLLQKSLSAKINSSIERQMVTAASSGKLTIMRNVVPDAKPESWSTKSTEAKKAKSNRSV